MTVIINQSISSVCSIKKYILLVACCFFSAFTCAKNYEIKHLEPLNWWVGMQHPELQLMVHGDNISTLTPEINYPGVTLINTVTTDNKNYLFINVNIAETTKAGKFVILFKTDNKVVAKVNYRLENRVKNSAERKGFDANDVIYLLMPDRFASGTAGNDSVADQLEKADRQNSGGRHGGDLKGMQDHLDYIANMGFTMIWPTPLI
jgi:hypothetical protein